MHALKAVRSAVLRASGLPVREPDARRAVVAGGLPEVALNQRVKNLIQKLGEAIHESVAESEHIAGVVKNLREQGFEVLLMLEATIGLNEVEDEPEAGQLRLTAGEQTEGPFTQHDVSFLRSLRISLPEEMDGAEDKDEAAGTD